MREVMQELFGVYTPLVDIDGNPLKGIGSLDFEYILGVSMFMLCLFCLFKIIGSIIK